jgi:hypothetical protein
MSQAPEHYSLNSAIAAANLGKREVLCARPDDPDPFLACRRVLPAVLADPLTIHCTVYERLAICAEPNAQSTLRGASREP